MLSCAKNTDNTQTKHNPEKKQTTQNTAKQKYPCLVAFYNTRPGNEAGLFYNTTEVTGSTTQWSSNDSTMLTMTQSTGSKQHAPYEMNNRSLHGTFKVEFLAHANK